MIAAEIEAGAAIGHRAHQQRLVRAEIVAGIGLGKLVVNIALDRRQIENGSREVADGAAFLVRHIARHGQRFQINFRRHDGRAEAQHHAAFQALDGAREDQEIAIAGRAERRAIAIGMFVQDVVADAHVHGDRYERRQAAASTLKSRCG